MDSSLQPTMTSCAWVSRHQTRRGSVRVASGVCSLVVTAVFWNLCLAPPVAANALPFRAINGPDDRFTVSSLTAPYERDLDRILDLETKEPTDLAVLDAHGWFPMDDVPYRTDTYDMLKLASEEVSQDPLTPEEEVAGESGTAGVQMGIPSPVAVAGSILGGLGLLATILADWF